MRIKSLILALAASSALALAAATPALAIHNGWKPTTTENQGGSTNDCGVSPNPGCTIVTVEQPKGQATDPPKDNSSPKDTTKCSGPPGQQPATCP
jgi:hypothetical protein